MYDLTAKETGCSWSMQTSHNIWRGMFPFKRSLKWGILSTRYLLNRTFAFWSVYQHIGVHSLKWDMLSTP